MMHRKSLRIGIFLLMAPLSVGCRLPGHEGPVPQSLADCRRLSQQGVSALEHGKQPEAEALLSKAVAVCPIDAEARRHYAESLWRRGANQEAIAQLEETSRLLGDDASLRTRLAEMYLASGQKELALQNANAAVALDPKLAGAWAIRGGALRAAGQRREALADYLRALGRSPDNREVLLAIAELHCELDRPDRALQTLQNLADTYSPGEEPGRVLYLTGLAYLAVGRYDDSVKSLADAVTRDSPTPEMLCHLGEAQLLAGHSAQATEAARQALAMQPQHQPSRDLLLRIEVAQQPRGMVR